MERSSYNEMLRLLNEDKKRLKTELELIETAISTLTLLKTGATNPLRLTNDFHSDTTNTNKSRKNHYVDTEVAVPAEFKEDLTVVQLLIYALNKLGLATVDEATDYILKLDPSKDRRYIFTRFRDIASGLYRADKIYADTKKKKYKYSLKEIITEVVSFDEKVNKEIDSVFKL
jgi:hypothetical protein